MMRSVTFLLASAAAVAEAAKPIEHNYGENYQVEYSAINFTQKQTDDAALIQKLNWTAPATVLPLGASEALLTKIGEATIASMQAPMLKMAEKEGYREPEQDDWADIKDGQNHDLKKFAGAYYFVIGGSDKTASVNALKASFNKDALAENLTKAFENHPRYSNAMWTGWKPEVAATQIEIVYVKSISKATGVTEVWFDFFVTPKTGKRDLTKADFDAVLRENPKSAGPFQSVASEQRMIMHLNRFDDQEFIVGNAFVIVPELDAEMKAWLQALIVWFVCGAVFLALGLLYVLAKRYSRNKAGEEGEPQAKEAPQP